MRFRDTFSAATASLRRNRKRSLLTMLGVVIGVGSVVLMTSVGASMERLILSQISSIGAKSMVIFPGQQSGPEANVQGGFDSLTFADIEALEKLTTITSVAPAMFMDVPKVTYGSQEMQPRVIGTVPNYFRNREVKLREGRLLEDADISGARNVAVIASEISDKLFGRESPIGKRVNFGDRPFTIVGALQPIGTQFFQNVDDIAFVPLPIARSATGHKYVNIISMQSSTDFSVTLDDVTSFLRLRHGIVNPNNDPKKDDFVVRSSEQANDILAAVSLGLTLFITTIAAISLVVGGIGIMNIMLVAVTERTREIGLRKAIGARRRDVLLQFLCEAVLLTFFAGVLGVFGGVSVAVLTAAVVHKFLETYSFALSLPSIGLALLMALLTGLGFGIYPARKAAYLSPMEALRYE